MLRRAPFHARNGFTTIEALIAAVVFLVGLVGLLGALVQARSATGQARRFTQATDIANDLAEQIQLWDFNDPRLSASDPLCAEDPMDENGKLLHPTSGDYGSYVACMHGEETIMMLGPEKFGGLAKPSFTDESGVETQFERYYIVRLQDVREGVRRMQIWVKVIYKDAGEPRVVTTQAMRIQMGGV
jgi:type II secretory pathway pseudopilin PulG